MILSRIKDFIEGTTAVGQTAVVSKYEYASFQGIGAREQQQDCYFISRVEDGFDTNRNGLVFAVADGMGGMDAGERFSSTICNSIQAYVTDENLDSLMMEDDIESAYLNGMIARISTDVEKLIQEEELGDGGSTLCCVHIADGEMSYVSVGDSHIYVLRQGVLRRINKIHNLRNKYLEKLEQKEISWDDYRKAPGKDGLTSYIGADDFSEIDIKANMKLYSGDVILIFSDGVFGTLSEEEIKAIAMNRSAVEAAYMYEEAIGSMLKEYQDNFTGIIIRCF